MSWQQGRRTTAQAKGPPTDDGFWSKAVMFLDGASYIIAFYLVDTFTFGPPQLRVVSPSVREEFVVGTSPGSPVRRFASESEVLSTPVHRNHTSREKSCSESQMQDARQSDSSSTSCCSEKTQRHKDDYFANKTLHHYQKKIFGRQVERTLQLQPYVRLALMILGLSVNFLIYIRLFGVPMMFSTFALHVTHVVGLAIDAIKMTLRAGYHQVQMRMPLPRRKQTGFDVLLAHIRACWTILLAWSHSLLGE